MTDLVFFRPERPYSAGEIAEITGASLADPTQAGILIHRIAPANDCGDDALVFIEGKRNAGLATGLKAAAVICSPDIAPLVPQTVAVIVAGRPQHAFATVARLLYPAARMPGAVTGVTGVSSAAVIGRDALIEPGATVEGGAVVGAGAAIGSGTVIAANAVIGPGVRIGRDGYVGPGATILASLIGDRVAIHPGARIGQDGFGYVPGARGLEKMPQVGRVVIQDDVEIGANTTVDRGAMSDTIIGEGTKIDNLVQIAHNVRIGRHCAIAAQCGLSGSVVLGDYVMLGGSVGIADHVVVGSGAQLAARSGVMHDIPAGERWGGAPAQPMRDFFREVTAIRSLVKAKSRKATRDE